MTTCRAVARACLLIAVVVTASAAPAAAGETVGVLHLETVGVSETAAEMFEKSIEDGLSDNGFTVLNRERLHQRLSPTGYPSGCYFGPCLSEVFEATSVRLVLIARITGLGSSYTFVVSLLDTRTGMSTSQIVGRCEVCTLEEAITTATLEVVGLVHGSGAATVADPRAGATGSVQMHDFRAEKTALASDLRRRRSRAAGAGWAFLGAAVLAGGASAYLIGQDDARFGYPTLSAAGILAVSGGTMLILSRRF